MSVFETFRNIGASEYRCGRVHADTRPHRHIHTFRSGFSLTEILIVIGLIVLMLALAVPTFNFLTGNRSLEGAQNTVAALIGRARAEAIGLQETRGVFFFIDESTRRVGAALVREVEAPRTAPPADATFTPPSSEVSPTEPRPEVWLDLVPETEIVTLPPGVMLQTIDDAMVRATGQRERLEDAYIGYNRTNKGNASGTGVNNDTHTLYGGVILFNGGGQLVARRYAFKTFYLSPPGSPPVPANRFPTRMGDLLYRPKGDRSPPLSPPHEDQVNDVVPLGRPPSDAGLTSAYYPKSQLGVVLFDRERWRAVAPPVSSPPYEPEFDWQFEVPFGSTSSYIGSSTKEDIEEGWIDQNGLPLLVNRHNGTLVRAQ
jgi:type II secretory pathway pseudopilin PulG